MRKNLLAVVIAILALFSSTLSLAADQTAATIERVNDLARAIGYLANEINVAQAAERRQIYDAAAPTILATIASLQQEVAANHLSGTLYEDIVAAQAPQALGEIRALFAA